MTAQSKRIGLLVPSSNTTMEVDFVRSAPSDVTVHTGRLYLETNRFEDLMRMHEDVIREAKYLATADVNVIVFGCTGGSFVKGVGYDLQVAHAIEEATGIPAVTTSTALVEALRMMEIKRIVFGTPYPSQLTESGRSFFAGNGFEVLRTSGLGITRNLEIGKLEPKSGYDMACELNGEDVEAIVLSCTNWPVLGILERAEKHLGKPVLSSNQASLWGALKVLDYPTPVSGLGILMQRLGQGLATQTRK
jgi:maleate cis-trans isomerase